jgi:hypothetical protein
MPPQAGWIQHGGIFVPKSTVAITSPVSAGLLASACAASWGIQSPTCGLSRPRSAARPNHIRSQCRELKAHAELAQSDSRGELPVRKDCQVGCGWNVKRMRT